MKNINISSNKADNLFNANSSFLGCKSLENISLPNSMINLGRTNNMFEGCSNLKYVNLDFLTGAYGLINYKGMFKECSNLINISFPIINAGLGIKEILKCFLDANI